MKVLVLYYSKTGNTKILARAVAEGVESVEGVQALLRNTDEVTKDDFINCDGVIVGSPVYFGTMAWPVKEIIDKFISVRNEMESKVGAAFTTAESGSGGKETTLMSIVQALMIYGMIIVGAPLKDKEGNYGVSCLNDPDERDKKHGYILGRRVAQLVKALFG